MGNRWKKEPWIWKWLRERTHDPGRKWQPADLVEVRVLRCMIEFEFGIRSPKHHLSLTWLLQFSLSWWWAHRSSGAVRKGGQPEKPFHSFQIGHFSSWSFWAPSLSSECCGPGSTTKEIALEVLRWEVTAERFLSLHLPTPFISFRTLDSCCRRLWRKH